MGWLQAELGDILFRKTITKNYQVYNENDCALLKDLSTLIEIGPDVPE